MDDLQAKRLHKRLRGKSVGSWTVGRYIDHGKSAIVVEATRGATKGALKLFDPHLVDRFGRETQLARIERERTLINVTHPHLVRIYDGGECTSTGLLYVVMELIPAKNISQLLDNIPPSLVGRIIAQVASAAQFLLEAHNTTHRDIKPSNVALSPDYRHATLLDLGVQKPLKSEDITDLTDEQRKPFVGTLRYASPEYLLSEVQDTADGWKAVTFYQLGATLHDMIMKRPLFREFSEPYPQLVRAVLEEHPSIHSIEVEGRIVRLAECCLVKGWEQRLQLVSWSDFAELTQTEHRPTIDSLRAMLVKAQNLAKTQVAPKQVGHNSTRWVQDAADELRSVLRSACIKEGVVPRHSATEVTLSAAGVAEFRVELAPSPQHGLHCNMFFIVRFQPMDPITRVLQIAVVAGATSLDFPDCHDCDSEPGQRIWVGAWDVGSAKSAVFSALLSALLLAVDLGQACPSGPQPHFLTVVTERGEA